MDRRYNKEARDEKNLVEFCLTPRSSSEIAAHIGIQSVQYALKHYLEPLVQSGRILITNSGTPRSRKQKYVTAT